MKKLAICDDDPNIVDYLKKTCTSYYRMHKQDVYIDCFSSGTQLLKSTILYDYLFLDIELQSTNGIEIAKQLRQYNKKMLIIIISGHQKYKSQAYSIHAFDYLDKPITKEDIFSLLKEAESYKANSHTCELIKFKTITGEVSLDIDDILYLEYKNRKIYLHTLHEEYQFYGRFSDYIAQLKPFGFDSPHRAFLIHFKYLKKIVKNKEAILLNNDSIPISKLKVIEFKKNFFDYLKTNASRR